MEYHDSRDNYCTNERLVIKSKKIEEGVIFHSYKGNVAPLSENATRDLVKKEIMNHIEKIEEIKEINKVNLEGVIRF